jgi:hypothetical protein
MLFLSAIVLFFSNPLQAQQANMPPSRVNVKFIAKYPQQADKATWEQANNEYLATFTDKGRQTVSRFSENGQWLGSQTQLLEADWEKNTRQYLEENHEGYKYLQGYRFDDAKGRRYQLDVQGKNGGRYRLDFDGQGNFVNERPLQE